MDIWADLGQLFSDGDSSGLIARITDDTAKSAIIELDNPAYTSIYGFLFGGLIIASFVAVVIGVLQNRAAIGNGDMDGFQYVKNAVLVQVTIWLIPFLVTLASYMAVLGALSFSKFATSQSTSSELFPSGLVFDQFQGFMGFVLLAAAFISWGIIKIETEFFGILVFATTIVLEISLLSIITKGKLSERGQSALSWTLVAVFWPLLLGSVLTLAGLLVNGLSISVVARQVSGAVLLVTAAGLPFLFIKKIKKQVKAKVEGNVRSSGRMRADRGSGDNQLPSSGGRPGSRFSPAPARAGASTVGTASGGRKTARQTLREIASGSKSDVRDAVAGVKATPSSIRNRWTQGKREFVAGKQQAGRALGKRTVGRVLTKALPPQIQAPVRAVQVARRVGNVVRKSYRASRNRQDE